jgi:DNA-binding Xre family transcriptional regulator
MKVAVAGEAARILASIKRVMKARAITYKNLAERIDLSEVSIKRIFSHSTLSLARLEQICRALDISIREISGLSADPSADTVESLSLEQESELAADPTLLACYYLVANGRSGFELSKELGVEEIQVRRWLVKLHSLGLVELLAKNRARARTGSAIVWRQDGPIRRLYESKVREEYLMSTFSAPYEALHFRSAELSEESCRLLLRKLSRLAAEVRDLAELDRSIPSCEKRNLGVLIAARPWVFSMFQSGRRLPKEELLCAVNDHS